MTAREILEELLDNVYGLLTEEENINQALKSLQVLVGKDKEVKHIESLSYTIDSPVYKLGYNQRGQEVGEKLK